VGDEIIWLVSFNTLMCIFYLFLVVVDNLGKTYRPLLKTYRPLLKMNFLERIMFTVSWNKIMNIFKLIRTKLNLSMIWIFLLILAFCAWFKVVIFIFLYTLTIIYYESNWVNTKLDFYVFIAHRSDTEQNYSSHLFYNP
jgi:hypothetical protein